MSIESSEHVLAILRILLVVFTSLVAIGLVLEYKTPLYLIAKGFLRLISFKSNSFDRCALKKMCWNFLGALLVTVGVAGEFVIEYKQNGAESDFSRASASARDHLNAETADARRQAGEANARASANDVEVQQLKSVNLQLELIVQPRTISMEDQRKIADTCGEFKNHGALIESYGMDTEAFATGSQIIGVLQTMKVVVADARASKITTGPMETGIHVRTTDASEIPFASCFAEALNRIGKLKASLNDPAPPFRGSMMGGGGQSINGPHITVMVGIKPLPLLTDKRNLGTKPGNTGTGTRGQERVKKLIFAISAKSAPKNLSIRKRISNDRKVRIHFWLP